MSDHRAVHLLQRVGARWLRGLPAALVIAAALVLQLTDSPFRARLRDLAFDQLQSLAPQAYHDELPVRVVAIDDASLASLGQWPWPRTVLARMVDQLTALGARVVVFDLVLSEPDRSSPEQVAAAYPDQPQLQQMLRRLATHDQRLADSMARSRVVLGFPIEPVAASGPLPPLRAQFLSLGGAAGDWLPHYSGGLAPLPLLGQAAAGSAAISMAPGNDGVLRAVPLLYQVHDNLYPGLALEALRLASGQDKLTLEVTAPALVQVGGITGVALGTQRFLATAPDGRVWLHFRPMNAQRYVSAQDLLTGRVDARQFKDHLVFIGATAKGLGDALYSPLGELIPGIEGHVQLTEQLLSGSSLLRPAWENDALLAVLLLTWLVLVWRLARVRSVWSLLLVVGLVAGCLALSGWLFVAHRLVLDPIFPTLAITALWGVVMVPRYLATEREQRWIRHAFSRYVSPNRVRFLQANPQQLALGAVYRECSFVMTDLEGFTPLMEQYAPDKLSSLINDYLEGMIQIVFRHDGTLDRIVGDAVVVVFSAPLVQADHAQRALACALEMDQFAQACSGAQRAQGVPFGRTRIGVNTGRVLVGNFGGKSLLDYRALGDAINTAARLESINKQLGTWVCVSGATVAQCPGFVGRPCGELVLKGKTEAVATYEPLTAEQAAQPQTAAYLAAYHLMAARAPQAREAFGQLAARYPDDPLVQFHARRLATGELGATVVMGSK